jgi:hypothetical protein
MVARPSSLDRRDPLPVIYVAAAGRLAFLLGGPSLATPPTEMGYMTPKRPIKKPSTNELLHQLIAQVAELRGRIERMESKGPGLLTVYKTEEPRPSVSWWSWITGE